MRISVSSGVQVIDGIGVRFIWRYSLCSLFRARSDAIVGVRVTDSRIGYIYIIYRIGWREGREDVCP